MNASINTSMNTSMNMLIDRVKKQDGFDESYYLVHFFGVFDQNLKQEGAWEIGFYSKKKNIIRTYVCDEVIFSKEAEALKKKGDVIKELCIEKVRIKFDECLGKVAEVLRNNYMNDVPIKGFVVLQNLSGSPVWNMSLITKNLKTINVKLNAENGNVEYHGVIQLKV